MHSNLQLRFLFFPSEEEGRDMFPTVPYHHVSRTKRKKKIVSAAIKRHFERLKTHYLQFPRDVCLSICLKLFHLTSSSTSRDRRNPRVSKPFITRLALEISPKPKTRPRLLFLKKDILIFSYRSINRIHQREYYFVKNFKI